MGGRDPGVVAALDGGRPTPASWADALPPDVVDAFGRYLRARGLASPRIDWAEIDAAKKEGAALFDQARRVSE